MKTRRRKLFLALLLIPTVWLLGDFTYSRITAYRYRRWEAGIERSPDGVRVGSEPFSIGNGETAILLIHGYADSPRTWRRAGEALAAQGYHCRAMRLGGFAEPIDALKSITLADWLGGIRAELAELRARHATVWVAAHSTGASLALLQAINHPGEQDGLVLVSPLIDVADSRSPVLSPRAWHQFSRYALPFSDTIENVFPEDVKSPDPDHLDCRDRFMLKSVYTTLYELIDALDGRARELTVPSLFLLADEDHVIDLGAARNFIDGLTAPSRTVTLTNSYHVVPIDADWQQAVRETAAFIEKHTAQSRVPE